VSNVSTDVSAAPTNIVISVQPGMMHSAARGLGDDPKTQLIVDDAVHVGALVGRRNEDIDIMRAQSIDVEARRMG
jgi:hypothetical protein